MALVRTGTFVATVPVTNLPQVPAPAVGTGVINYSPFILTNTGRSDGAASDVMIVHDIAVEPADGIDNTTNVATGSVAIYVCTTGGVIDGGFVEPIVPLNSAVDVPTGISARSGTVGGITGRTPVSSILFSPSHFSASAATVASLNGPMGALKLSPSFPTSGVEPLGLQNNEAIQIRKVETGTTDAVLAVTVQVRNSLGQTFLVEGVSGFGSDIVTILNTTGSILYVTDVTVNDWYRATSILQRYDITVSTANIRVDSPAEIASMDSTMPLPSWVTAGSGFFVREGGDMWVDFVEVLDVQVPLPTLVFPTGAPTRSNRPFITGRNTSKHLRPGKTLIFQLPANTVMNIGSHDIKVTFSTYAEPVAAGGGEYSYAY